MLGINPFVKQIVYDLLMVSMLLNKLKYRSDHDLVRPLGFVVMIQSSFLEFIKLFTMTRKNSFQLKKNVFIHFKKDSYDNR